MNLIEKAIRIAVVAHKEQIRKTDGSPYVAHPLTVAFKLMKYNFPDEVIAAAVTHDVLEDTEFSEEKLKEELGEEVLSIIKGVSEDRDLEWKKRKENYIQSVKEGGEGVWAVSIGDKIHNAESVIDFHGEHGADTWSKFSKPKDQKLWFEEEMLKMFQENWQHPLVDEYKILVDQMKALE